MKILYIEGEAYDTLRLIVRSLVVSIALLYIFT